MWWIFTIPLDILLLTGLWYAFPTLLVGALWLTAAAIGFVMLFFVIRAAIRAR